MKYTALRSRQNNEDLYWSNEDGWVDLQSATLFTISEVENFPNLPLETHAIDNIRLEKRKRVVEDIRKEFPPSKEQKNLLLNKIRNSGLKDYQGQRELCIQVLETQAAIQCYDEENLDDLLTAIAANINDGTLDCECLEIAMCESAGN